MWAQAQPGFRLTHYRPAIFHLIGSNEPWKDRKAKHHPKYRMAPWHKKVYKLVRPTPWIAKHLRPA
jgi:hypothetical protein